MKKIYFILVLAIFSIISCSKDEDMLNAPKNINNTSWHKHFNKSELKSAVGGVINASMINSMDMTYKILGDSKFEMITYISSSQGNINQTHSGTYTYNSSNGQVVFTYSNTSLNSTIGRNSDTAVINGNKMILGNRFTFEKQ